MSVKCERCGKEDNFRSGSFFVHQMCCMDCLELERLHPLYQKAKVVEHEQVVKGNFNFEGIGIPQDLADLYNPFETPVKILPQRLVQEMIEKPQNF